MLKINKVYNFFTLEKSHKPRYRETNMVDQSVGNHDTKMLSAMLADSASSSIMSEGSKRHFVSVL